MKDWRDVANPGSAIGEAIGVLFEDEIKKLVEEVCGDCDYIVDAGGPRPEIGRTTKKNIRLDRHGVTWENDVVVENSNYEPVILIECKWLRYTKHCRDKGGWVFTAHSLLRESFPTIRKTMVTLAGSWTKSSIDMMEGNYTEVHLVPFDYVVKLLATYDIPFDWDEKDKGTAHLAWERWNYLEEYQKTEISRAMVAPIRDQIKQSVLDTLNWGPESNIEEVKITFRTDDGSANTKIFSDPEDGLEYYKQLIGKRGY